MAKLDWEKANKRVASVPFFDKSWETEISDTDIKDISFQSEKKPSTKSEPVNQEEYRQEMHRHAKKRAQQKQYRANKRTEAIKRKEKQKNNNRSFEAGKQQERERIIKLLEPEVSRHYDIGLGFTAAYIERTIEQIKGEQ